MKYTSLFGYQSNSQVDCLAYDMCILAEEAKHKVELEKKEEEEVVPYDED